MSLARKTQGKRDSEGFTRAEQVKCSTACRAEQVELLAKPNPKKSCIGVAIFGFDSLLVS